MSVFGGPESAALPLELAGVAEAAGNRLRAEIDGDADAAAEAAQALVAAATSAMGQGLSLSQITEAEAAGKSAVREALRPDTLKLVERTARHLRAAQADHHRSILRAVRLGLSTRQVAVAAGVTHGTIRAIANRLSADPSEGGHDAAASGWSAGEPGSEEWTEASHPEGEPASGEWTEASHPEGEPGSGEWTQPSHAEG